MKPYVVNMSNNPPAPYVYVGRSNGELYSPWGNPFVVGVHGTRSEVIAMYEKYILGHPGLMARLPELKGAVLACWCAPLPCHADVLLRLANQ